MTREKWKIAAEEFKEWRDSYYNKNKLPATMFIEEVIKILEQEPCSDAISRQMVNTLIDELARAISDERCCISRGRSTATIMQDILDLPPVNLQEPKTGHWIIKDGKKQGYDIGGIKTWYIQIMCDKCGFIKTAIEGHTGQYNFCPNCGAKIESKEV